MMTHRSLLDPPPVTPIGSLGDKQSPYYATVLVPSSSGTSTTLNVNSTLGGLLVYGQTKMEQYVTSEGNDTSGPENDPADGEEPDPEEWEAKQADLKDPKKAATVTAEFYFEHLKANMTKTQMKELQARITDLTAAMKLAPFDQQVLREETQRLLAVALLQQKAAVMGYDQVVSEDDVDQFRSKVEMKRPEIMELRYFPRILPAKVVKALDKAKKARIFDQFWVLTWNPAQEQVLAVTDRIVRKDPILFGKFAFDPFYLYYITSWEDETCDLTFDKMIASLKELHPDYEPAEVTPLTAKDADRLIEAAQGRAALLKGTNSKRYRTDALEASLEAEDFTLGGAVRLLKAIIKQLTATARRKKIKRSRV
jgi:hypothetical protein